MKCQVVRLLLCILILAWSLDESSAYVFSFFNSYQRFSIAVFTSLLSRRWRCCEPLCSTVIRLDLRLAGARQEERLAAHFPLQPVEMRSLHNIYPRNNDVWFDSLLGVSVQRLFSSSAAAAAAATERHQTEPTSAGKGKKGASDHCLWMMPGWCISVLGHSDEKLLCCTAGSVTHTHLSFLFHALVQLRLDSLWIHWI